MLTWLFLIASVLALTAAMLVVMERSPVVSALDLAICLVSIGGIYLMMDAALLAAIQIFVYAGAVVVLFLFVVMLLSLGTEERKKAKLHLQIYLAPLFGVGLLYALFRILYKGRPFADTAPLEASAAASQSAEVGRDLLVTYLYPFEITSVLLLAAMVAAVVLSKRKLS